MTGLFFAYDSLAKALNRSAGWLVPTLARVVFAAVLFFYFWNSALTKIDGSIFTLDVGAYVQMFPVKFDAVGYDPSALSFFHRAVALLGTWAEFALPVMIVVGLFTRLAALGMIGFVIVQSLTDIVGHHADEATIGALFDGPSGSLIMDQRALWVFVLVVLVIRGAGPLSADWILGKGTRAVDPE